MRLGRENHYYLSSVTDLISAVVALLRRDIDGLARTVREVLELVKLWDEG
jgi:hypothetical protein